jgi:hypothetical protein
MFANKLISVSLIDESNFWIVFHLISKLNSVTYRRDLNCFVLLIEPNLILNSLEIVGSKDMFGCILDKSKINFL